MTFASDAAVKRTALKFINRTLPKPEWTHEAHFAVALYLLNSDEFDAFAQMPTMIRAYNEATGIANTDTDGYHETITLASLCAARHISGTSPDAGGLIRSLTALMSSAYGRSDWLLTHWTKPCLFSPIARHTWVAPDLTPLPFAGPQMATRAD